MLHNFQLCLLLFDSKDQTKYFFFKLSIVNICNNYVNFNFKFLMENYTVLKNRFDN